jgi:hypothetical protein
VIEYATPLAKKAVADTQKVVQAAPSDKPEVDAEQVTKVRGDNPAKSGDVLFVISKEPSVLFKKKRQDPAEGTRIDIAQGASKRIAIANNEILRVAEGSDIEVFYQGRKVASKTIESGAWMRFVPYSSDGASDSE